MNIKNKSRELALECAKHIPNCQEWQINEIAGLIKSVLKDALAAHPSSGGQEKWTPCKVFEIMGKDYGKDGWERERRIADAHNATLK